MKRFLILILSIIIISGCEKIFFDDDPENIPENNFEIFWTDFDRYYAQFGIRDINWDSIYTDYKSKVSTKISDKQLFDLLSDIVIYINDMHVNLYSPYGIASWKGWGHGSYPSNKLINPSGYFNGSIIREGVFEYQELKDHNIGYIKINTFAGVGENYSPDVRFLKIDEILELYKNKDGIIIDVRANGGGNSLNADAVAGRFADIRRLTCKNRNKNGTGKNDFSGWISWYIEPKGIFQYTKPVVVLTSRSTSSSAETFINNMQVLPQVTIIGDTTGGGTGNPIFRELPNGWTYRLSTKYAVTADDLLIDGKGIYPDLAVLTSVTDSISGIDKILEKGIEIIEQ